MRRTVQGLGVSIAVILGLGLSIGLVSAVSAQTDSSPVTIHKSECPAGYTGDNYFDDCHNNPVAGVTFQWSLHAEGYPQEITTDENGSASFDAIDPFLGMTITEENVGSLAEYVVYCSKNDGAEAVYFKYREGEVGILVPTAVLAQGDSVVCDWYDIPPATQNGGQATEPAPASGETATLPSTGIGSAAVDDHDALMSLLVAILLLIASGLTIAGFRSRPS